MTTTIVSAAGTTTPDLVLGYETTRESRNIVHDLLDGGIAVSIYPARPRSGTLRLFYTTEEQAQISLWLHGQPTTFSLASDDLEEIDMTYVVYGAVEMALDEGTVVVWTVSVGYQEVIA